MNNLELSLENIEFIKILATSESTILEKGMNDATRTKLDSEIGTILRQYYKEKTTDTGQVWTEKFKQAGISDDLGKAAIACARRLGVEIS